MDESSPLRVTALVANSAWGQQLSGFSWVEDEDAVLGVGLGTADEELRSFNRAQIDALGPIMNSDASRAIAAVSAVLPGHLHLFVYSLSHGLALWQDELQGPLTLLRFVSQEEVQQFPDHHVSCPLGHEMPGENKPATLQDHFRVSSAESFDTAARTYEAQLQQYFALEDQAARTTWLDRSSRGLFGDTDAERIDPVYVPGKELRRCTGRCGYYHWSGSWLRARA